MRAIIYRQSGETDVLQLVERPEPVASPGEVLIRVAVSGVNPTDWKSRKGAKPGERLMFEEVVPNQDGAGTIIAVGEGVDPSRIGQRVWIWESAYQRANGTAQEVVALPESHAVPLPDFADWDLGASLGIPALTAHRCLTVHEGVSRLSPGALNGLTVLVAGGAGAVGHAAIELARWAGAQVISSVSSKAKEALALAAGAHYVVDYRRENPAKVIRSIVAKGVDIVVEVAPRTNATLNQAVLGSNSVVAIYASDDDALSIPIRASMGQNLRYQFVMVYSVPAEAKALAVSDVQSALTDGALRVGADAGLPLHHYSLEQTAEAHAAVENHAIGKVLIDVNRQA